MAKLKPRSSFWLTRFLNLFGGNNYWTTIGDTIYYPDGTVNPEKHLDEIEHEEVHVVQFKKYIELFKKCGTAIWIFLYAMIPFPIFFAYFRWKSEREAYMVDIRKGADISRIVNSLWWGYFFTWPPCLMSRWFHKQLNKERLEKYARSES